MASFTFLLLMTVLSAGSSAEFQLVSGDTLSGTLIGIDGKAATVRLADDQERTIPLNEIFTVSLKRGKEASTTSSFPLEVLLVDGSRIKGRSVEFGGRDFAIQTANDTLLTLTKTHVRGMRFPNADQGEEIGGESLTANWTELLEEPILGDAIVLVREGELTHQEVIITNIEGENISIQLDDIQTDVNREKLFGLLFYQRQERRLPISLGTLETHDGSSWQLRDMKLQEDQLEITSLSGVRHQIPLSQVESFDFAAGNILFLTEISPDRTQWNPFIGSLLSKDELALVYAPRFDSSFREEPLSLERDGKLQNFAKGIAAQAKTEIIYTLPEGFQQFRALIGLSPRGSHNGGLKFSLVGDQRILAEELLTNDTVPRELVVDVSQVRRLRIIVDFSESSGWGDVLHICQPRILK
ncbi:MAG: NPCBM/NEW2 domain-containing protein [Pirellulaceae bacterium]